MSRKGTYVFKRFDVDEEGYVFEDAEGEYVLAEDAINILAIRNAQIQTLEAQLKALKEQNGKVSTS